MNLWQCLMVCVVCLQTFLMAMASVVACSACMILHKFVDLLQYRLFFNCSICSGTGENDDMDLAWLGTPFQVPQCSTLAASASRGHAQHLLYLPYTIKRLLRA